VNFFYWPINIFSYAEAKLRKTCLRDISYYVLGKLFNEQDVIEKAVQAFWERGNEVKSIINLIDSTGKNRSLYNSFGVP